MLVASSIGCLALCFLAGLLVSVARAGEKKKTPFPLAWLHFNERDENITFEKDQFFYYTGAAEPIELEMRLRPNPRHKLAVKWMCRKGDKPDRAMEITVNGRKKLVVNPAGDPEKQVFFWDVISVKEFGITSPQTGKYEISIQSGGDAYEDGLLGGVCMITDHSQLRAFSKRSGLDVPVAEDSKTTILRPGRIAEAILLAGQASNPKSREPVPAPKLPARIAPDKYLTAAAHFADAWLAYGIDDYGHEHTPLLADLIDTETLVAPRPGLATYKRNKKKGIIVCDYSGQQNFLRVLDALTNITDDSKYRKAGEDSAKYMFEHYWRSGSGLFAWGQHYFLDLDTSRPFGNRGGNLHELKGSLPCYEFLYRVDPERTSRFMQGFWLNHIRDWKTLAFTRHGNYNPHTLDGSVWKRPWKDPGINHAGGLAFIATGFELANGAIRMGILEDNPEIARWGERIIHQYMRQAHPKTKLIPTLMYPTGMNRMWDTFQMDQARENVTYMRAYQADLVNLMVGILALYDEMPKDERFYTKEMRRDLQAIREHLKGYFKYAYNPETHRVKVIATDGTDLTGFNVRQRRYGFEVGPVMESAIPFVMCNQYSLALKLFPEDKELWNDLRTLLRNEGVCDIGSFESKKPKMIPHTKYTRPQVIFALVDLFEITKNRAYLDCADAIAENIHQIRYRPKTGLFTIDRDHYLAQIDVFEPLAFITLWAAKHGKLDAVPRFNAGGRYLWDHKLTYTGYGEGFIFRNHKGIQPFEDTEQYKLSVSGKWLKEDPEMLDKSYLLEEYKEELRKRWNMKAASRK